MVLFFASTLPSSNSPLWRDSPEYHWNFADALYGDTSAQVCVLWRDNRTVEIELMCGILLPAELPILYIGLLREALCASAMNETGKLNRRFTSFIVSNWLTDAYNIQRDDRTSEQQSNAKNDVAWAWIASKIVLLVKIKAKIYNFHIE